MVTLEDLKKLSNEELAKMGDIDINKIKKMSDEELEELINDKNS